MKLFVRIEPPAWSVIDESGVTLMAGTGPAYEAERVTGLLGAPYPDFYGTDFELIDTRCDLTTENRAAYFTALAMTALREDSSVTFKQPVNLTPLPPEEPEMKTHIWRMNHHEHRSLCGLVAKLIPHLQWRHSGLGMLQAYVHEGTTDEMRVHVWCKELEREGIVDSGLLHDHRFDLVSQVLVGEIKQVEYELRPSDTGDFQLHEVVHARAAGKHAPNDGLVTALSGRYAVRWNPIQLSARDAYSFPKWEFHGTLLRSEYAVTVITKSNQDETPARILAPFDKPVVHAFADPLPEVAWAHHLSAAAKMLLDVWRGAA